MSADDAELSFHYTLLPPRIHSCVLLTVQSRRGFAELSRAVEWNEQTRKRHEVKRYSERDGDDMLQCRQEPKEVKSSLLPVSGESRSALRLDAPRRPERLLVEADSSQMVRSV